MQRAWDRYDRLSVISALVVSPSRQRISVPFQIFDHNIRTAEVVALVKQLRRQFRRPLIIIWDRWSVHRSAARQLQASCVKHVDFEWLPAYAPELNPVEARWSYTKFSDLCNFVPDDTPHLQQSVQCSLKRQSKNHSLKRSFFKTARLNL